MMNFKVRMDFGYLARIAFLFGLGALACTNGASNSAPKDGQEKAIQVSDWNSIAKNGSSLIASTNFGLKNDRKIEKDLVVESDGGAHLTGYLRGSSFSKVSLQVGLSNAVEFRNYYFGEDGSLKVVEMKKRFFEFDKSKSEVIPNLTEPNEFTKKVYIANGRAILDGFFDGSVSRTSETLDFATYGKKMDALLRSTEMEPNGKDLF